MRNSADSPPHFRDGGRARRAHGARPAGIGARDGKPDGKPGRLSRHRADARIGAELLQALTGEPRSPAPGRK